MFEPYNDTASTSNDTGLVVTPHQTLLSHIRGADQAGLQCSIHAIGDQANHVLLNIYQQVSSAHGPRDRRFRIEHAQTLRPADLERFRELSVIASAQPFHLIDDGVWAEKLLGWQRVQWMYPFHSLLERNVTLAFGSDWFVAPPIPLQGIFAAVTRATLDGKNPQGWVPAQRISELKRGLGRGAVVCAVSGEEEQEAEAEAEAEEAAEAKDCAGTQ